MKIERIIIGVDDNKFALHAAKYGFELAHTFKAHVGLVHIIEPIANPTLDEPGMMGSMIPTLGINEVEVIQSQDDYSTRLLENTVKSYAGDLQVTKFSQIGSTADALVTCAVEFKADLIVVGTHNRTGIERLFMGNVAEHVVRNSYIPVLVVPMEEAE